VSDPDGVLDTGETRFYRTMRWISRGVAWYFRFRVEGAGNLPAAGPCIVAANHASYLDAIVLAMAVPRPLRYLMDKKHFELPVVHWFSARFGAIPVDNSAGDLGSLRRSLAVLKHGGVLGIFPEGGRSPDGSLQPAKPGVALLARRTGVPVVPAGIVGSYAAMPRGRTIPRRDPVTVRFGPPLLLGAPGEAGRGKGDLEEGTARIMGAIEMLLR
jgi:1-acyl-sn-glycerol-3-phosphate acyltransferase